ncbi:MAG: large subunit ribosomal protein [Desulfovibrionales bacterium]|nr:large subunit ribosomal protein [Desulfovibrionales bacterium]
MANINILNQTNDQVGSIELAPEVFEVAVRPEVLHLVVRSQLAANRQGTHATKTRGLNRGGGRKPWRQKGTGRARSGSTRSPLWRGGGTIFGPQPRSYDIKVNRKVKRLALRMALSSRLAEENLMVLDAITLPEIKTKGFAKVAADLGLKKALIVFKDLDNNLVLSARNIPGVTTLSADQLNVYDVLRHPQLVFLKAAVEDVQERLK